MLARPKRSEPLTPRFLVSSWRISKPLAGHGFANAGGISLRNIVPFP
jgi:hypothetical protein